MDNGNNHAIEKKAKEEFLNSLHFGMNSRPQPQLASPRFSNGQDKKGEKTPNPATTLVSPFLFKRPLSLSSQFHHRNLVRVSSPSSDGGRANVTTAFLKASPFMAVKDRDAGTNHGDEYVKIKVVESPFLQNENGRGGETFNTFK